MPIPENQSQGALLFSSACSACHALPHPRRHTPEQWQDVLLRMNQNIQNSGLTALTGSELDTIRAYLHRHARD